MKSGFKDLLFYPDTFFKNIALEKVNLIPPVIIVAGGCAISLLGTIIPLCFSIVYTMVFDSSINWMHFPVLGYAWYLIRCYVLWPSLGWILLAVILYLISRLFSQSGSFPALLQNVGYGMLPWVVSSLVSLVVISLLITQPEYHTNILLNPATVSAIIFYAFLLWCCCVWVYAIKHTCQILIQRAIVVVVLGVLACFIPFYLAAYIPVIF
ncbi:MAG: YIP1 family protein [Methanoregula sp.]|nr:MAG: YIP1 family protein [Methanoregula sp.]